MVKGNSQLAAYPVEVSGWDEQENFFVENTTLEWCGQGTRRVLTRRPLHKGAVIFVRLLECRLLRPTHPIAYRVLSARESGERGVYRAELGQLRTAHESEGGEAQGEFAA
jgi:hypothetical protein